MSRFVFGPPPARSSGRRVTLRDGATEAEIYAAYARSLTLPEWFGANLDALWDALSGLVETPVEIVHHGLPDADDTWVDAYLELLVDASDEVGARVYFDVDSRARVERYLLSD
jgi:RNAse (barnase) inhibitor barstar